MKTIDINNTKKIIIDKYKRKRKISLIYQKKVCTNDLKKCIKNYEYLKTFLEFHKFSSIYEIDPHELLSPINYDIFIKYLYLKNINNSFFKKMYLNHIKAFNNFKEPDGSKNSKKDFLIACKNFVNNENYTKTIVPISKQGIIIDGSHRIAMSIIKNKKVQCTDFDIDDLYFNFSFFIKRGLKKKYCQYVGFAIIELVKNITFLKIKYTTKKHLNKEMQLINENYDVYYYIKRKKEVLFLIGVSDKEINNNIIRYAYNKKIIKNEYSKFINKHILKKCKELGLC